jgi:hypothetical protein
MGKLVGLLQVTGKVGELNMYKHKRYGILVRKDTSHSKERMENDPAFAAVKKNYNLFGEVSSTARLIRDMLKPIEKNIADGMMNTRLVSLVRKIYVNAEKDAIHPLHSSSAEMLSRFSFNKYHSLANTCYGSVSISREDNTITLEINKAEFVAIPGATHLRVVCSVGEIDFITKQYSRADEVSEFIKVDSSNVSVALKNEITGEYPVTIVVLGVMYYQLTNGSYYKLDNGKGKAGEVVKVYVG